MLNLVFPSEEPEEEVSFEDIEERAKSGDAKSQTKVSVSEQIANAVDLNKHMAAQQRAPLNAGDCQTGLLRRGAEAESSKSQKCFHCSPEVFVLACVCV